jgi:hypothetical protein
MTVWQVGKPGEEDEETKERLPKEAQEALDALQYLWGVTGQIEDHLIETGEHEGHHHKGGHGVGEGCGASVGLGGLGELSEGEESTHDREQAMSRMRQAWKTTMAREGKLNEEGGLDLAQEPRGAE